MKKYPSVWITQKLVHDGRKLEKKFDINVKLSAMLPATHYTKDTEDEAIKFCIERFGKYDSLRKDI